MNRSFFTFLFCYFVWGFRHWHGREEAVGFILQRYLPASPGTELPHCPFSKELLVLFISSSYIKGQSNIRSSVIHIPTLLPQLSTPYLPSITTMVSPHFLSLPPSILLTTPQSSVNNIVQGDGRGIGFATVKPGYKTYKSPYGPEYIPIPLPTHPPFSHLYARIS